MARSRAKHRHRVNRLCCYSCIGNMCSEVQQRQCEHRLCYMCVWNKCTEVQQLVSLFNIHISRFSFQNVRMCSCPRLLINKISAQLRRISTFVLGAYELLESRQI